jgi:predicted enzyme related to lactoylglutathione lyase
MIERTEYPPGVPCWVDSGQPDPEAAAEFYGGLFGWQMEETMPAGAPGHYLVARLDGLEVAAVGSLPPDVPQLAAWNTYVCVESADRTADAAREAGGTVLMEPFDIFEAGRMAVVADPAGAMFCIWQPRQMIGAKMVNEPGSWNWSDLRTSDPEGAKAFYAAVFGWEAVEFDVGPGTATLLRAPGYGDFLERTVDPQIRKRQEGGGAPPGFEDAIGWLVPLERSTTPDAAPHWHVTFAVDDADALAARAAELGGEIVAAPTDMPWVRISVLRDPQGAAFSISKFQPPERD